MRYRGMKTKNNNKDLQSKLEVKYENQGFNGNRSIVVPIMYDPLTGVTYDVGDFNDLEEEKNVLNTKETRN